MSDSNPASNPLCVFECHNTLQSGQTTPAERSGRPTPAQFRDSEPATALVFECSLSQPVDGTPADRPPAQPRSVEFLVREKIGAMGQEIQLLRTEVARLQDAVNFGTKQRSRPE